MADNQRRSTSVGSGAEPASPYPGMGGWPSNVQMPSGGLLDPLGQDPTWRPAGANGPLGFGASPLKDGPVDFRLHWGIRSGGSPILPTGLGQTPAQLKTRNPLDHLNDPNVDKLKDGYGNPSDTQYLTEKPYPGGWAILGDLMNLGLGAIDARVDPEIYLDASEKLAEDENVTSPEVAYDRLDQYGRTPTRADRNWLGAGQGQVANHEPTIARRWYFGDPARGEIPGYLMTPSQRAASAADRTRMNVQSQSDSNVQGGEMAAFSRKMRRMFRIDLEKGD
jgi:hypothetical protein